ncbi:MAG: hypothetical protein ACRC29_17790 [Enterobacterales bacterium]
MNLVVACSIFDSISYAYAWRLLVAGLSQDFVVPKGATALYSSSEDKAWRKKGDNVNNSSRNLQLHIAAQRNASLWRFYCVMVE